MRVGLIARAEDRGLGIQTWEFYRGMAPDRVLLVDAGERARGFKVHDARYPEATVLPWNGALPEDECRAWLEGVDVVYSAETFYDWHFCDWAREAGVATVVHANPEFYTRHIAPHPSPTVWWSATPWRLHHLPAATRVVPQPCPIDRWPSPSIEPHRPVRWLHVAGHRTIADRNGTNLLWQALRFVQRRHDLLVVTQDAKLPTPRGRASVKLEVQLGGIDDYWKLYDGRDALVLPRRYGGLCLPAIEAMGAGLGVLMSDCEPQRTIWPVARAQANPGKFIKVPTGRISLCEARPSSIAAVMDRLADDPGELLALRREARAWAEAHSWEALAPLILEELARAVEAL